MSAFTLLVAYLLFLSKMISCLPRTDIEQKMERDIQVNDLLNVCLQSDTHKPQPGAEDLTNECSPWRGNACCTQETVEKAHEFSLYSLNYDMCPQKKMSEQCKKYFIRDTCFYECSPNIGPWKEEIDSPSRIQRFRYVPLCYSECNDWFNACAEDYSCADNWTKNYDHALGNSTNNTHICEKNPSESCRPIKEIFGTPENFCEKIWDNSWKVVNDSEPCMKLSFNAEKGENPNTIVAKKYAYATYSKLSLQINSSAFYLLKPNNTFLFLIFMLINYYYVH